MSKPGTKFEERKVLLEPADDSYGYQPLNEMKKQVRIFRLAPGEFDQPIRGSLIIISLDKLRRRKWQEMREWLALSYVWGPSDRDEAIRISRRKVFITRTLRRALQYFRWRDIERYLWIDQICINQDDVVERGSQVQLMRNIYAEATFVVAWLGTGTTEVEDLLCMMKHAGPILNNSFSGYKERRRNGQERSQEKNLLTEILRLYTSDVSLEQVINTLCERLEVLFNNAWFKRVWTLQEAVSAFNLILQAGWTHATWDDIFQVYAVPEFLEPDLGDTGAFQNTMFSMTSLRLSVKQPEGRNPALPWTGVIPRLNRVASDDRDYVYGQLGLFNAKVRDFLKPDYSARVESVFMAGTLALLKADENLDTLGICCAGCKRGQYTLPSWCRDWSDGSSGCGIRDDNQTSNQVGLYKAASTYNSQITYESLNSAMCVRGVVVDEIGTRISESTTDEKTDLYEAWRMISRSFLLPGVLSNKEDRYQALCRTLINDTFDGRSRANPSSVSQAMAWLRYLENGMNIAKIRVQPTVKDGFSVKRMTDQIEKIGNGFRSLFETTGHRFGRSCTHVLPGDKICLLYGGRLPFVLRKAGMVDLAANNDQSTKRQAYQLIGGECYVHGLVDGEGLKITEREDSRMQDFCLI
jgi:hypothetical protein